MQMTPATPFIRVIDFRPTRVIELNETHLNLIALMNEQVDAIGSRRFGG